ncbi:MAG TPA: 3-hydroxyacyl-CoA dehydrogenase family protein, partial [Planctomycetota bacterium]|nr:3-hydroxyacyl-CoA dehydrogenase family protein [Planctomycetota bacterium]
MAFLFQGREIKKIGVVGSGQIGPDIALYFAKVLASEGVSVVVVDIQQAALDKGMARLHKKVDRGVEGKAFKAEHGAAMKAAVTFTTDYEALKGASLVVEAATEDVGIKRRIFAQLEGLLDENVILASNSSHLEPEVIGAGLAHKGRGLVVHYFFPAERNYMVEVVPSPETRPEITAWTMAFYEAIGKVPVQVQSRYGYAVDPVFEGVFLAAALCVEEGLGTTKEVDAIAAKALGLTVGPFTAMNLTGGNPITVKGLPLEGEKIMPWFRAPKLMLDAVAAGTAWDVPGRGEKVEVPADRAAAITERMQGAYLGLCDEILTSGIINLADFELAIEMGLDMKGPVRLANELGIARAVDLIES